MEFGIESYFLPSTKEHLWISHCGLLLTLSGEVIRKLAMITAGQNFSHRVEFKKERGHSLVTHGVYSLWRHPSYLGWLLWSIGTQLILMNPICIIGYSLASWSFFKSRIREEESILIEFFGDEYREYMKRVPPGIPFLDLDHNEQVYVSNETDD
jgi:protein-S-isoprenylcysteine O-methyltransferase